LGVGRLGFLVAAKPTIMNWKMISAIGQMLGAIGVIISIVYLAAQIRNQNKESQRQAMHVLTTHWSDLNRTLVENPEMTVLWLRALRCFDASMQSRS
jgi:heme/copper-type cytochrome/quinol oxidase subunit 1